MLRRLLLALLASAPLPALANDSTAELGTGGLILSRNDMISMDSEDLKIADTGVTVDYVFTNHDEKDVDTIVAFPMPEVEGNPFWMPAIPNSASDNFLDFTVTMDGKPINARLEQRVFAVGIDVTKDLEAQGIPLNPYSEETVKALEKISEAVEQDWVTRGIIIAPEWDDGSGMTKHRSPFWKLRSTFWWDAKFPAKKSVAVSHSYKPSVGATSGLTFFYDGKFQGQYDEYAQKYCIDEPVKKAVLKAAKESPDGYPQLYETRISYVLTTGGNWSTGTIGKFKLTVDKGNPRNIVSFCGDGIKKTGPTTFEVTADDYYPARDIEILILRRWEDTSNTEGTADMAARSVGDAKPSADMAERGWGKYWWNGANGPWSKRNEMVPGPKQGSRPDDQSRAPKGSAGDSGE